MVILLTQYNTIKLYEAVDSTTCQLHTHRSHNKHLVNPYFGSCPGPALEERQVPQ